MTKLDELKLAATEDILGVKSVNTHELAELLVKECTDWINDNVGMVTEDAVLDLRKHIGLADGN